MFIGHFAVGFAAKRSAPRATLGALMAAPLLLDLVWPFFLLTGWEQVRIDPGNTAFTPLDFVAYPYSHSLLTTLGWATLAAVLYHLRARYWRGTIAVWTGVVSHWVMDAIVHRPDLPVYPGASLRVGLGLWNSIPATLVVELLLFAGGVWLYARTTRASDRVGKYGFWAYVSFLIIIYFGNLSSAPPANVKVIAVAALLLWLMVPWAWWFDRHRTVRDTVE